MSISNKNINGLKQKSGIKDSMAGSEGSNNFELFEKYSELQKQNTTRQKLDNLYPSSMVNAQKQSGSQDGSSEKESNKKNDDSITINLINAFDVSEINQNEIKNDTNSVKNSAIERPMEKRKNEIENIIKEVEANPQKKNNDADKNNEIPVKNELKKNIVKQRSNKINATSKDKATQMREIIKNFKTTNHLKSRIIKDDQKQLQQYAGTVLKERDRLIKKLQEQKNKLLQERKNKLNEMRSKQGNKVFSADSRRAKIRKNITQLEQLDQEMEKLKLDAKDGKYNYTFFPNTIKLHQLEKKRTAKPTVNTKKTVKKDSVLNKKKTGQVKITTTKIKKEPKQLGSKTFSNFNKMDKKEVISKEQNNNKMPKNFNKETLPENTNKKQEKKENNSVQVKQPQEKVDKKNNKTIVIKKNITNIDVKNKKQKINKYTIGDRKNTNNKTKTTLKLKQEVKK